MAEYSPMDVPTFHEVKGAFLMARAMEGAPTTEAALKAEWFRLTVAQRRDLAGWLGVAAERPRAMAGHEASECDGLCRAHGAAR